MAKYIFTSRNFRSDALDLIDKSNRIIEDYQGRGYELTLRQLYYQLVSRDLIPNTEKSYNKLGSTISNARDAGLVDWEAIVDRTREREGLTTWETPGGILRAVYRQFRIDKWDNQPFKIFVWVEKEALAGVIERACFDENIQVDYVSCRGYMSASTIWREARNIREIIDNGQTPVILHLGDHDPSGMDMTRDNTERLELYSESQVDVDFDFIRIALNMDQVDEHSPPPNPAKITDSRSDKYIEQFGESSWELDALDPDILVSLVRGYITAYIDDDLWKQKVEEENEYKNKLEYVYRNWKSIG